MNDLQKEIMRVLDLHELGKPIYAKPGKDGISRADFIRSEPEPLRAPLRQAEPQSLEKTMQDIPAVAGGIAGGVGVGLGEAADLGIGLLEGAYKALNPDAGEGRFQSFVSGLAEQFETGYGEQARSIVMDMGEKAGLSPEQLDVMDESITAGSMLSIGGATKKAAQAVPGMMSKAGDGIQTLGDRATAQLAEAPGQKLMSGPPIDDIVNKGFAAAGDAVKKARAKKNIFVGAPKGIDTRSKLNTLRRNVEKLAIEGADARFWYERSGKAILDAVGGDKAEAEKIAQIVAITSAGTPVKANFDFALQAYAQHKAGQPIMTGRFPTAMSKRIEQVLGGQDWEGRKTNNFYVNLMRVVDPQKVQGVTTDLWMMRSFGFDTDNPTDAQYTFVERETNRIADRLEWEPQQAQAAIWVAQKAKEEGTDIATSKFDYSDALDQNLAQISWESIPGRTSSHMLEMFDAPYEVQQEYHVAVSKAFQDDDGFDLVARRLGIPTPGDFEAPGYFEGKVSPGTQSELVAPKQYKVDRKVEPAAIELIEAYAAVRGILMKQDGVGYHRPFYQTTKAAGNGIEVRVGRAFSEAETKRLADLLKQEAGFEIAPIGASGGVRIINFDPDFDNKEFQRIAKGAIDKLELDDDADMDAVLFASQNGLLENNWSASKNGEEYISALGAKGRPDLQRKVQDIINEVQPRIDEIDSDFSERYGFTRNEQINSNFRRAEEQVTPPQMSEQAEGINNG
jgi:hypothetical protein